MRYFKRMLLAGIFALVISAATFFIARGQGNEAVLSPQAQVSQGTCTGCHSDHDEIWRTGAHGNASNDPVFNEMWTDQGKPGACLVCHVTGYDPATGTWEEDGVACIACHNTVPVEHLKNPSTNPAPVDRTSDLCGRCHTGERFNIQEWQGSSHFQRAMTCTVCHDPHAATLKVVQDQEETGPSALCINCHSEVSMAFPYSKHNQSGVSCVNCHLRHFNPSVEEDVHALPDHSFNAQISTCTACHAEQMHAQSTQSISQVPATPVPTPVPGDISSQPSPVSPVGYASMAGMIGLAGGMILQPWLEKLYRKMNKKGGKK